MIRVSDAGPPEGDPVATWQPKLFPGLYPESTLRQSEMFPREERGAGRYTRPWLLLSRRSSRRMSARSHARMRGGRARRIAARR